MISVEQAFQIVIDSAQDFGVEEIPFIQSAGRILKEQIKADRDFRLSIEFLWTELPLRIHHLKTGKEVLKLKEFRRQEVSKLAYKIQKIVSK